MLYYLFEYLDKILDVPGTGVFQYIFRSALALLSLFCLPFTVKNYSFFAKTASGRNS
jgi:hypothetical protein